MITDAVLHEIHTYGNGHLNEEICGVLVGNLYRDDRGPFLLIDASVRGEHANRSVAGVTFTAETWTHIHDAMEKLPPEKRIVGWYHTHPTFGIFLSSYDVFIHQHFFDLSWQVAFVYDPCRKEEGLFAWDKGTIKPTPWTSESSLKSGIIEDTPAGQPASVTVAKPGRFDRTLNIASTILLFANLVFLIFLTYQVMRYRHELFDSRASNPTVPAGPLVLCPAKEPTPPPHGRQPTEKESPEDRPKQGGKTQSKTPPAGPAPTNKP